MHLGIDFDNTIVRYDDLFYAVACEKGLIPAETPHNKLSVREAIKALHGERFWTILQGEVYGEHMHKATPFSGVIDCLRRAHAKGIALTIISHKTRHPVIGPRYDLHQAARDWVARYLTAADEQTPIFDDNHLFFAATRAKKAARIAACRCDWFIDDLPEVFQEPAFPSETHQMLFDPDGHHVHGCDALRVTSWKKIGAIFHLW